MSALLFLLVFNPFMRSHSFSLHLILVWFNLFVVFLLLLCVLFVFNCFYMMLSSLFDSFLLIIFSGSFLFGFHSVILSSWVSYLHSVCQSTLSTSSHDLFFKSFFCSHVLYLRTRLLTRDLNFNLWSTCFMLGHFLQCLHQHLFFSCLYPALSCLYLCLLYFFFSGRAAASGALSAVIRWGGRRWRAGGRPGLHWVQPSWRPLRRLWLHLRPGVSGEWDRPGGHCLHHPPRGQSWPRLRVGPPDGEAGDVLRPAGLPPGQVHHCRPRPADPRGDVPVCAAHGVHLPGWNVPTQGGICSTQEDLRLHQPEDEAACNWRGRRRRGRGRRWGVFGGTGWHAE